MLLPGCRSWLSEKEEALRAGLHHMHCITSPQVDALSPAAVAHLQQAPAASMDRGAVRCPEAVGVDAIHKGEWHMGCREESANQMPRNARELAQVRMLRQAMVGTR